jgi:hypothetical protein
MFCWHMARLNEGVKAARAAGYEDNKNSLSVEATRLMKSTEIRREILKQRQYYLASIGSDKDRLMAETLARAGIIHDGTVFTPHDFVRKVQVEYRRTNRKSGETTEYTAEKWTLVPKEELPEAARRMVQSIKISYSPAGEENIEVKFFDQLKAIELAARLAHLLNAEREDNTGDAEEKAKLIREALKRMDETSGPDAPYVEPVSDPATAH